MFDYQSLADPAQQLSPAARRKLADAITSSEFPFFLMRVFDTVSPRVTFRSNWHIEAMCHVANEIIEGRVRRHITNVPPRHLKSIIFSVALPALLLGLDPTRRIACVSYSHDLAVKHANDFRAVMNSAWYRRIFPRTRISPTRDTQTETLTTERGFRFATSVGGTLTGRGAEIIILDDPQKPDEAMSEAYRKSTKQWFENTLMSRLDSKSDGVIALVMQRVHEDDLVGYLLEKGGWEHLCIPATAEQDERIAVGPKRFHHRRVGTVIDPGRESAVALAQLRKDMGPLIYSAQYQQRPIPLEGNLIKREWFKYNEFSPEPQPGDKFVISIDTALKDNPSSDYSVATVWLVHGDNCGLLDLVRRRVSFPDLCRMVEALIQKWPRATLLVEDKGSGTSLIQHLRAKNVAVIPINPVGDKQSRVAKVSAQFESGCVWFPQGAPWLPEYETELLGFPNVKHDDQVDSTTQALTWMWNRRHNGVVSVAPIITYSSRDPFRYGW